MTSGARTPEELDHLLEDAFVLHDHSAPKALFADGAVLADTNGLEARGREQIATALACLWAAERGYVAQPERVLQTRDTALLVGTAGIHVLRRAPDRTWRAAISLLYPDTSTRLETHA